MQNAEQQHSSTPQASFFLLFPLHSLRYSLPNVFCDTLCVATTAAAEHGMKTGSSKTVIPGIGEKVNPDFVRTRECNPDRFLIGCEI